MYPSKTLLYAPACAQYSGPALTQRATASSLFNHAVRNSVPYSPCSSYSPYSTGNLPNPYAQLEAQKSTVFSSLTHYPCAPSTSGTAPAYPDAYLYSYAMPMKALRTNSSPGLEAVLIAILILTALDLTLIRPNKYYRRNESCQ